MRQDDGTKDTESPLSPWQRCISARVDAVIGATADGRLAWSSVFVESVGQRAR